MLKRIEDILFLLLFVTFLFLSILFSSVNENEINYDLQESSSKKFGEQFLWTKSTDKELANIDFNDFAIPSYDPSKVSIFGDAVRLLMEYYVKIDKPLQIASVSDETSKKVYSAAYIKPKNPYPSPRREYRGSGPAEEFFFKNYDEYKKVTLPQKLISNGHMAAMNQFVSLPRTVTKKDFDVKFSAKTVEPMFMAHYNDYFELDVRQQFGRNDLKPRKARSLVGKLWRNEGKVQREAYTKIREDLLRNKSVVKLTGCRYRDRPEKVIVYYDLDTNLFCIVGEKTNNFITGGIASLCDYIDVYYFKWLYNNKAFDQSVQFFDKPIQFDVDINSEEQLNPGVSPYEEFDIRRDKGLPKDYNPANWWETKQQELIQEFLKSINKSPEWYHDNLEVGDRNVENETSKFEAFTMLQFQAENYVSGIYRPDKKNDPQEALLDSDARFNNFNPELIRNCKPTIIDVKALIDPKALISRPEERIRTLEQQVEDVTSAVKFQQVRAKTNFNETVLHVINLFRIRPVDRSFVIALFQAKAIKKEIDLDCVIFLNTNDDSIY